MFTWRCRDLVSEGAVVAVEFRNPRRSGTVVSTMALVDTGAQRTAVGQGVIRDLGVHPHRGETLYGASGQVRTHLYVVDLQIQETGFTMGQLTVVAAPLPVLPHFDRVRCLLGRDVLAHGTLVYLGSGDTVSLALAAAATA